MVWFLGFRYWATSESNNARGDEDCTEINKYDPEKSWNDEPCDHKKSWICEKTQPQ